MEFDNFLRLPEAVLRLVVENLRLPEAVNILYTSRFLLKHLRDSVVVAKIRSVSDVGKAIILFPKVRIQFLSSDSWSISGSIVRLPDFAANITEMYLDETVRGMHFFQWNLMIKLRKLKCHEEDLSCPFREDKLPPNLTNLEITGNDMDLRGFGKLNDLTISLDSLWGGPSLFPSTLTRLVLEDCGILSCVERGTFDGLRSVEFCDLDDFYTLMQTPIKLIDLKINGQLPKIPDRKRKMFEENINSICAENLRSVESLYLGQFIPIPLNFFSSMVCLKIIKIDGVIASGKGSFVEMGSVREVEFDRVVGWQNIVNFFPNVKRLRVRWCNFEMPLRNALRNLEELEIVKCDLRECKTNMRSVYLRILDCIVFPGVFEKITGECLEYNFGLSFVSFGGVLRRMGLRKLCLPDFEGFPVTSGYRKIISSAPLI
ncbi:MAG: hypothetical protein Hyperionvirus36_19 [Hyperionvirus sp.]|uniref:Uncharacterized protein n=1 Tax=Hyperionvirus sp. TaxID=2487770 RepID=A0A3G5AC64_9VIRU|nr:MAG: hypothetical protein Hyperionvirus36_19 [Hyperionvirus sp.]